MNAKINPELMQQNIYPHISYY